jgi:acetylornithine/succinyldiaminopimelate/putrescine aminotransferase
MIEENVPERAQEMGAYFKEQLAILKERHDYIVDIRGMGLLIGMELSCKGAPVVTACLNKGFVINCIQERVLRFLPPLKVERKMIDALVVCLDTVLTEMKL